MWKNYIKTALRNIRRNRVFSFINVFGLATGVGLFIIISLFVHSEYSYDKFNQKIDRIYRLERGDWGILGPAYGPEVAAEFPEIESFVRFNLHQFSNPLVTKQYGNQRLQNVVMADPELFNVFTFRFLEGSPMDALQDPYSIVLTESCATKLFGAENPIGKDLLLDEQHHFKVTAVIEDPHRFHMDIGAVVPFETLALMRNNAQMLGRYDNWNYPTFFLLKPGVSADDLEKKVNAHLGAIFEKLYGEQPQEMDFFLRPLDQIYFASVKHELGVKHGNENFAIGFAAIAVFILVIACINFINLTTAKALSRAKEVGLRKTLGGYRSQLISQFLIESFMITVLAFILSLGVVELLLNRFKDILQAELSLNYLTQPFFWFVFIGGILFVGLLSGLYPAFYLTRFSAVSVIKGEQTKGRKGVAIRNGLTVFQFIISVVLIIGTLIVYHQIDYMKSADLGFNKGRQLYFRLEGNLAERKTAFKQALLEDPRIIAVSYTSQPAGNIGWQDNFEYEGEQYKMTFQPADPDYMKVMGFELSQGDNFSWDKPSQYRHAFLINETAARSFDWSEPVGKIVDFYGEQVEIIGVVRDFHYNSLHNKISPLVIAWDPRVMTANIKLNGYDPTSALDHIRSVWQEYLPSYPFQYHFLDDSFDQHYRHEEGFGQLFVSFAAFAILIACLGLYGLSLFTTQARLKEIGVRKANGAHAGHIIALFLKSFTFNVLIANLLAWPTAYWIMQRWLNNFPYRMGIGIWIFGLALIISLCIAAITVFYHTFRAANINPALTLRDE